VNIEKTWTPNVLVRKTEEEVRALAGSHVGGEPFERWQAGNLVGTPQQVIEKIGRYVEMGVTSFLPWHYELPVTEGLQLVAEQVIPAFR
jgi:alkanesulfonate monooxygenase SsuD/methylene tetrahydromethanopterin reductase-like flavin-dependent oxidoreductase (luciferase family)